MITLSQSQLEDMMFRVASMAVRLSLKSKDEYTRAEMCRMHGRGRINRLIKDGRLVPKKDMDGNGRILYSESQYQSLFA